jgi:hypothetical protein
VHVQVWDWDFEWQGVSKSIFWRRPILLGRRSWRDTTRHRVAIVALRHETVANSTRRTSVNDERTPKTERSKSLRPEAVDRCDAWHFGRGDCSRVRGSPERR